MQKTKESYYLCGCCLTWILNWFPIKAADIHTSRNTLPEWFWSGISVDKLCNYLNYYLIINVLKWISDHWPRNYFSYLVCFASSSRQAFKYSRLSHNRHLNMQYFAVQIISDTRSWLEWVGRHELLGIHCCIY